jgi:hypothetical protein
MLASPPSPLQVRVQADFVRAPDYDSGWRDATSNRWYHSHELFFHNLSSTPEEVCLSCRIVLCCLIGLSDWVVGLGCAVGIVCVAG